MGLRTRGPGVALVALAAAALASTATAAPTLDRNRTLDRSTEAATDVRVQSSVSRALRTRSTSRARAAAGALRSPFGPLALGRVSQLARRRVRGLRLLRERHRVRVARRCAGARPDGDPYARRVLGLRGLQRSHARLERRLGAAVRERRHDHLDDYQIYDAVAGEVVYGPTEYGDAWWPWDLPDNTQYVVFLQEIVQINDNVITHSETALLDVVGPTVHSPKICRP